MGAPTSEVKLRPQPGERTTKSVWTWGGIGKKRLLKNVYLLTTLKYIIAYKLPIHKTFSCDFG